MRIAILEKSEYYKNGIGLTIHQSFEELEEGRPKLEKSKWNIATYSLFERVHIAKHNLLDHNALLPVSSTTPGLTFNAELFDMRKHGHNSSVTIKTTDQKIGELFLLSRFAQYVMF